MSTQKMDQPNALLPILQRLMETAGKLEQADIPFNRLTLPEDEFQKPLMRCARLVDHLLAELRNWMQAGQRTDLEIIQALIDHVVMEKYGGKGLESLF